MNDCTVLSYRLDSIWIILSDSIIIASRSGSSTSHNLLKTAACFFIFFFSLFFLHFSNIIHASFGIFTLLQLYQEEIIAIFFRRFYTIYSWVFTFTTYIPILISHILLIIIWAFYMSIGSMPYYNRYTAFNMRFVVYAAYLLYSLLTTYICQVFSHIYMSISLYYSHIYG